MENTAPLGPLGTADSAGLLSSEAGPLVRDTLSADAGAAAPGTTLEKSWPKERDQGRQGGSPVNVSIHGSWTSLASARGSLSRALGTARGARDHPRTRSREAAAIPQGGQGAMSKLGSETLLWHPPLRLAGWFRFPRLA